MTNIRSTAAILAGAMMVATTGAQALPVDLGTVGDSPISGSWNTTISQTFGLRLQNPSCSLTGDPSSAGCGSSANTGMWSTGDNGNLNYKKGQFFTLATKATTEILLHAPEQELDFLARGTFLYDPIASDTQRTKLDYQAEQRVVYNAQLLDLWVAKKIHVGESDGRIRLGNQVINWGESLFLGGGINATNAIDVQKSLVPGTQIKEYVLPAPIISIAGNVAPGLNVEAYYQFIYNRNIYPAVGTYWSTADFFGPGRRDSVTFGTNSNLFGLDPTARQRLGLGPSTAVAYIRRDENPSDQGQFGVSAHYKPQGSVVDYGFYFINYHDKAPVLSLKGGSSSSSTVDYQASFLENRQLYGASVNFPLGDWAIGGEVAYRPRDAVALGGCFTPGQPLDANVNTNPVSSGNCPLWIDKERHDAHLTALLQLSPTDYPWVLNPLGAQTAFLSIEVAGTHYTGIRKNGITRTVEGKSVVQLPDAAYTTWLGGSGGQPRGVGSEYSAGGVIDFNWTYDGTVIPGWQLTPGVTYFNAFLGNTPNFTATYLQGAQSANIYLLFNQNPTKWQAGLNYTTYFGGQEASKQPFSDRDYVGGFVSYTF